MIKLHYKSVKKSKLLIKLQYQDERTVISRFKVRGNSTFPYKSIIFVTMLENTFFKVKKSRL